MKSVNKFLSRTPMPQLVVAVFCFLIINNALAQSDIPIAQWRMHNSYNSINAIAIGNEKIFAASQNGVLVFDKTDNSLSSYTKLNGLSASGITSMNYDNVTSTLLLAYEDGTIDFIKGNNVVNFNRLKNAETINSSKRINHISIQSDYAYLATEYGLVVFDLKRMDVKETWRDLGSDGNRLKIYQSTFKGDSIFLATEKGVLVGSLNDNLLDYHNWKRFAQNEFVGSIQFITSLNNDVYAAINNEGIFRYTNGNWMKESFLQNLNFSSMNASKSSLWITENNTAWRVTDIDDVLSKVSDPLLAQPRLAVEDASGSVWIADGKSGLVSDMTGVFSAYIPNGPVSASCLRLEYNNNMIYAFPGGYTAAFQPLNNNNGYDVFMNGQWENKSTTSTDVTDASLGVDNDYFSSFGYGLEVRDKNELVSLFNDSNSPLVNTNAPENFVNLTAIEEAPDGLWIANYGVANALHLLAKNNTWQSFSFPDVPVARYPIELLVDSNGYVWVVLNPSQGGGVLVFDRVNNRTKYLTDQPGAGALPSKLVHSITMDRDGYVWVGTASGVAYFNNTHTIFSATQDAIKPVSENRYLLRNEIVTAIEVDGANRKWMGTLKGVWLFNATGETSVYNFTEENSPLLSNKIQAIEINDLTGEVFFATDKGIVSYRSNATIGNAQLQTVKIFPNPVVRGFTGTVGITGLTTEAVVKITDISGKLVWQTQANGGTATWNVQDYNGRRAVTGMYLVFAATPEGTESIVGKIAVID